MLTIICSIGPGSARWESRRSPSIRVCVDRPALNANLSLYMYFQRSVCLVPDPKTSDLAATVEIFSGINFRARKRQSKFAFLVYSQRIHANFYFCLVIINSGALTDRSSKDARSFRICTDMHNAKSIAVVVRTSTTVRATVVPTFFTPHEKTFLLRTSMSGKVFSVVRASISSHRRHSYRIGTGNALVTFHRYCCAHFRGLSSTSHFLPASSLLHLTAMLLTLCCS